MTPEKTDYRATVFLPTTSLPMKAGLPEQEPKWLAKWAAADLYAQLRSSRRGREKFILHDGPPYANGDMHIGHALNHILKDMVVRTQSMLGKDAPYVPGWDCHGLPIEWKVEEQYRKKKLNKDEVPVKEFRAECRAYAQNWVNVQRDQLKRLGINGDWDNPYLTMDFAAEATIVSELLKFAESEQLYRGAKPVMWSPVEKTALAEAEIEYEDITSTQIDVAFEIIESPIAELVGAYAVIWTTTPWTIPVNQAIAYGPEVEYVILQNFGMGGRGPSLSPFIYEKLLVARSLFDEFSRRAGIAVSPNFINECRIIRGSDLAGTIARHPMHPYYRHPGAGRDLIESDGVRLPRDPGLRRDDDVMNAGYSTDTAKLAITHPNPSPEGEGLKSSPLADFFARPRPFLPGDFVTTETGTGLVHMAPDHGEDDFDLCKAHGIEPVFAVTADGKYRDDWAWLGGQGSVINPKFNAPDGPICSDLREAGGLLAASADYKHSYPHSWRSKAKVIYRCTPQWFVPMDRDTMGKTLRETALKAITDTRWVPAKGENRIRAMVEGRPDWVLSRQRAWGVPITLFVNRKTGQYLCDPAVNARIIDGIKAQGVDAWDDARAQEYLGADYNADDFERVTDILDVWFDSGCTHSFVLSSGRWPDLQWPADLYLEGSDQHRGWFQSSLLQSCGTRGRAPYKAVLTHGFTMDQKGMKMSKSLGNTIDPLKVMQTNGADIVRLWALSVDYTEDHRIGDEILKGVADQYRKLRNTFRYLLGALNGFTDTEKIAVADMPELERYMLHLLSDMDAKLRTAVNDFDFNTYVRLLNDFANNDLSAFFFDIRKDSLYCDGVNSPQRRAVRTTMDIIFKSLAKWLAPVLVFTAEEVWQCRYGDIASIHMGDYEPIDSAWANPDLSAKWARLKEIRSVVTGALEIDRREKRIGASLESAPLLWLQSAEDVALVQSVHFADVCITSDLTVTQEDLGTEAFALADVIGVAVQTQKSSGAKCSRCWQVLPEVGEKPDHPELCFRCYEVVTA